MTADQVKVEFGRDILIRMAHAKPELCLLVDRAFDDLLIDSEINFYTKVELLAQLEKSIIWVLNENKGSPV